MKKTTTTIKVGNSKFRSESARTIDEVNFFGTVLAITIIICFIIHTEIQSRKKK